MMPTDKSNEIVEGGTLLSGFVHRDACRWLEVDEVRMEMNHNDPPVRRNAIYGDLVIPRRFYHTYFTWRVGGAQYGTKLHPYMYLRQFKSSIPHPNWFLKLFGRRVPGTDWELDFDAMMLDLRDIVLKMKKGEYKEK